jgi:hypothetical protein
MHPEPGGHYAAHLEPEVLADDIREFFRGSPPDPGRGGWPLLLARGGDAEEAPAVKGAGAGGQSAIRASSDTYSLIYAH